METLNSASVRRSALANCSKLWINLILHRSPFPVLKSRIPYLEFVSRGLRVCPILQESLYPEENRELCDAISNKASSLPPESDQIFVCISFSGSINNYQYQIVSGAHLDEEKAVSWDWVEPFNEVLQLCKPPIPCLRKTRIEQSLLGDSGCEEELCCAICLQEMSIGSEAARTTCSHLYHCHCIVKWLLRSSFCPLCRSRLPVA